MEEDSPDLLLTGRRTGLTRILSGAEGAHPRNREALMRLKDLAIDCAETGHWCLCMPSRAGTGTTQRCRKGPQSGRRTAVRKTAALPPNRAGDGYFANAVQR